MIQLYEFINKQKTSIQLTDELIESFDRLMNSTYDDCIINESLVFNLLISDDIINFNISLFFKVL